MRGFRPFLRPLVIRTLTLSRSCFAIGVPPASPRRAMTAVTMHSPAASRNMVCPAATSSTPRSVKMKGMRAIPVDIMIVPAMFNMLPSPIYLPRDRSLG